MNSEDRNPFLQSHFAGAEQDLNDDIFIEDVMAGIQGRRVQRVAGMLGLAMTLAIVAWLLAVPLQAVAIVISETLGTSLVDLGDSWLSWAVSPFNNVASILVLLLKMLRTVWHKVTSARYVN